MGSHRDGSRSDRRHRRSRCGRRLSGPVAIHQPRWHPDRVRIAELTYNRGCRRRRPRDVAHGDRRLEHRSDITGTAATLDIPGTIDLARTLHPGLQRIAVVAGTGMLDGYVLALFHEAFKPYEGQLELIDLSGLFLDSLMDRVSRLPASTAILYIIFKETARGGFFPHRLL